MKSKFVKLRSQSRRQHEGITYPLGSTPTARRGSRALPTGSRAAPGRPWTTPPAPVPAPAAGTPPETEADTDYFNDEDFVMGLPQGPPVGLYAALGVVVLALLAVVYYAL